MIINNNFYKQIYVTPNVLALCLGVILFIYVLSTEAVYTIWVIIIDQDYLTDFSDAV